MEKLDFQMSLLTWGKSNICVYPWRYSQNSYKILVSEFMLHRTQANQVIPVYKNFMEAYPTLKSIQSSDTLKIYDLLSPLGLYWRNKNMVAALSELSNLYDEVPLRVDLLSAITGIGQYIAGATVCFTMNKPTILIDTNTVRVVGRFFGKKLQGEARRRKEIKEAIAQIVDPVSPRDFYYSLIDLAHKICTPNMPLCNNCPLLRSKCLFGEKNSI